eukprot:8484741-Pyramimonas_sp.AAC.1
MYDVPLTKIFSNTYCLNKYWKTPLVSKRSNGIQEEKRAEGAAAPSLTLCVEKERATSERSAVGNLAALSSLDAISEI